MRKDNQVTIPRPSPAMTIYHSPISPFGDLASLSIPQFMTRYNPDGVAADKVVHRDALSSEALTYSSLRQKASLSAWGLRHELGVNPGDTILAIVTNSVRTPTYPETVGTVSNHKKNDFVVLAHATWWLGAVFAPLNTSSTRKDIEHVLALIKPTHIATISSKLQDVQDATASVQLHPEPRVFTVLSKVPSISQFPNDILSAATKPLPAFDLGGKSAKETPSTICFSSGTTGKMKGVLMSHYNLVANIMQLRTSLPARLNSSVREVWFTPCMGVFLDIPYQGALKAN